MNDKEKVYIGAPAIDRLVANVAECVVTLHNPCLWIILNGAFMFGADLMRRCEPAQVELLRVYRGYDVGRPHEPYFTVPRPTFLTKYTHVFVDVIAEEGKTLNFLKSLTSTRYRKHVYTCALIVKGTQYTPDIYGLRLHTNKFLTGYGMGPKRWLPYITEV